MCRQKKPGPKRDETTAGHAGSVGTGGGGVVVVVVLHNHFLSVIPHFINLWTDGAGFGKEKLKL